MLSSTLSSAFIITEKERNENTVDMAHASMVSLMRTIESLLTSNSPMHSLICDYREELCALLEKKLYWGKIKARKKNASKVSSKPATSSRGHEPYWKESTKIQDKGKQVSKESLVHDFSSSSNDILNFNSNMVGRDDQKEHLLEDLTTSYSGEPKVIPIVGMGDIGKKTLAKEFYIYGSILCRFDVHAKATLSQQHNIKKILLSLLQSTIEMDDTVKMKGEVELANMLQKSLKRKRYLIVLDDIWSCEVWDGVRRCFPTEDNAGSRILLTTHNNEVACYAAIENLSLRMIFMDQDESCSLFKSATFLLDKCRRFSSNAQEVKVEKNFSNLEVLMLMDYAYDCEEWHPNVRGFTRLKLLLNEYSFLKYWKATNDNFPVLERLVLKDCRYLKEIPIKFADIHSLQLIQLKWCLPELGKSAARIQKEQEDLENNPVDVHISDLYREDADDEDKDEDDETTTMRMMVMVVVVVLIMS
ncbi:hypothetical protein CQW23_06042 [Capsicum baccatum]|uniref:NB-ARC domain-containing protein n=1 Tax=Capsicum baccatum TaxID=33114 RepID=A0A2G2X2A0_CAPBA|nr:hypothetical protein CQW23_06042 [Capsicum baccatum]